METLTREQFAELIIKQSGYGMACDSARDEAPDLYKPWTVIDWGYCAYQAFFLSQSTPLHALSAEKLFSQVNDKIYGYLWAKAFAGLLYHQQLKEG